MKFSSYAVLVMLAAALTAAWLWQARAKPTVEKSKHRVATQVDSQPQESQLESAVDPLGLSGIEPAARESLDSNCKFASLSSLGRSHPIVIDVYERFSPILIEGNALEAYRNLSPEQVRGLAQSGDSMAMAFLGALEYLKVNPRGDTNVVDLLSTGDLFIGEYISPERQTASDIDALDKAAHWFNEAALHGRLSAVSLYAQVLSQRFGGAQELGWITAEQIKQNPHLSDMAHPMNVYLAVLLKLQPELQLYSGGEWAPDNPVLQSIIDEETRSFVEERQDRGLAAIKLAPARYTKAQIRAALCTSTHP